MSGVRLGSELDSSFEHYRPHPGEKLNLSEELQGSLLFFSTQASARWFCHCVGSLVVVLEPRGTDVFKPNCALESVFLTLWLWYTGGTISAEMNTTMYWTFHATWRSFSLKSGVMHGPAHQLLVHMIPCGRRMS